MIWGDISWWTGGMAWAQCEFCTRSVNKSYIYCDIVVFGGLRAMCVLRGRQCQTLQCDLQIEEETKAIISSDKCCVANSRSNSLQGLRGAKRCLMDLHPGYAALAGSDNYVRWMAIYGTSCRSFTQTSKIRFWLGLYLYLWWSLHWRWTLPSNIGLRLRMQPGDIVFLRAELLDTWLWTGREGKEFQFFFTHTSTWKMCEENWLIGLRPDIWGRWRW